MFKKLNALHILTHFISFWLFAHGFQTLSYLSDVNLAELIRHSPNIHEALISNKVDIISLNSIIIVSALAYLIGYIIAFVLSLLTSKRRNSHWVNSLISLAIFIIISRLSLTGWDYLKEIFLTPGSFFNGAWYYLIDGMIMLILGTLLILGKRRKNFPIKEESSIDLKYS